MSREIKFRAIKKIDRGNGKQIHFFTLEDLLRGKIFLSFPEHYNIRQYTGLNINGKEIYEGDIVKHSNGVKEVYWDNENISFQMGLSSAVLDQEIGDYENIEIIGNVHENPELLK